MDHKKQKTFLLCVGSQKSGTTWLYHYLNGHPNANMGFAKEYHVFDALYVPACRYILENRAREVVRLVEEQAFPLDKKTSLFRLLDFCASPDNYFDYFGEIVHKSRETLLTGDITPSYSALPVEALRKVKVGLEERGFRVKVVFIMRDPVERCISAGRLYFKLRGLFPSAQEENDMLRTLYKTEEFQIRTRYDATIRNLEEVFAEDDIQYFFYESLFRADSIKVLADFLMIPYRQPDFGYNPNASRRANAIDDSLKRDIYLEYRAVNEFVSQRFGASAIESWRIY